MANLVEVIYLIGCIWYVYNSSVTVSVDSFHGAFIFHLGLGRQVVKDWCKLAENIAACIQTRALQVFSRPRSTIRFFKVKRDI